MSKTILALALVALLTAPAYAYPSLWAGEVCFNGFTEAAC
jgi:hypothetical protein